MADKWDQFSEDSSTGGDKWSQFEDTTQGTKPTGGIRPWKGVTTEALDFGADFVEGVKNILSPILHPRETLKNLGALDKIIRDKMPWNPGKHPDSDAALKQIWDKMVLDYGTPEKVVSVMRDHPAQTLMTIAPLIQGFGKVTGLSTVAKAGEIIDPLSLGIKATTGAVRATGRAFKAAEGSPMLTGVGTEAVSRAVTSPERGNAFLKAIRGKVTPEEVVSQAKTAWQALRDTRNMDYRTEFTKLKNSSAVMDLRPVWKKFETEMKNFGVDFVLDPQGGSIAGLDFTKSRFQTNALAQNDFKKILEALQNAGDPARRNFFSTAEGFDVLKQQFNNLWHESGEARAATSRMADFVKDEVSKKVPGYLLMVEKYQKDSKFLDEISHTLSLGNKASIDTAFRKLLSTLKNDNEIRFHLSRALDQVGGQELLDKIAGYSMKSMLPTSGLGRRIEAGEIFGTILGVNPKVLFGVIGASPKLVGESLNALGRVMSQYRKVGMPTMQQMKPAAQALYGVGLGQKTLTQGEVSGYTYDPATGELVPK